MFEVVAFQIAASINIRQCRNLLPLETLFSDSAELFFKNGDNRFVHIVQYGLVSFFNHTEKEIQAILKQLSSLSKDRVPYQLSEKIQVEVIPGQQKVTFNKVVLPNFDSESIRLVMMNTSQSVALDRYLEITEQLLEETNVHTKLLEKKGKLDISGNNLKRFIGKVLNIKNEISENLYIFDSPDSTWENEDLNRLDMELKQTFDLKDRYRYISERIGIIKEDLELFKDIMEHRESSRLEWIIIILILVEVLDLFVFRIFGLA
ncbi:RMD1 family protein [Sediminicola sp. 1XM1-17]|uniref:RMD1 family protein n=1 Tax=Sediminicola sp. 1XM1-17 TaxID=3127702 RepID=UPI003076AC66